MLLWMTLFGCTQQSQFNFEVYVDESLLDYERLNLRIRGGPDDGAVYSQSPVRAVNEMVVGRSGRFLGEDFAYTVVAWLDFTDQEDRWLPPPDAPQTGDVDAFSGRRTPEEPTRLFIEAPGVDDE
ncbi:MAG: hypothetical protein AAF602_29385 [Myxococcota bacterium]